jgi:O-antigen/teichoic acid export membrane protein
MVAKAGTAARGTAALVFSRGCYFLLGYLAVVLLAREFGPTAYGVYGVIMAILVWLEESGRYAIPSATAKLLAEAPAGEAEIERSALALNLGLHVFFMLLLWGLAPWLASWLAIERGAWLIRLAAIDLPLFGLYTAVQAIHQGHSHFGRLGVSQVAYAFTKLASVLLLMLVGISLEKALLINVASTVVGLALLLPGIGVQWTGRWFSRVTPLVAVAVPIGLYYFPLMLRSSLLLGTLKILSSESEEAMIGILMAALNIARVPAFALATVIVVILPSISRALARDDRVTARHYLNQALRFFLMLFLPACFVLTAEPEWLMQFMYSKNFSGGGLLLSILVVSEGLYTMQAIMGSTLHAAGEMRKTAVVIILALLPSLIVMVLFIQIGGVVGAALSSVVTPLFGISVFSITIWRRFATLVQSRTLLNLALAGGLMFAVDACLPEIEGWGMLLHGLGLGVYLTVLVARGELTWRDIAAMVPSPRAQGQPAA